MNDPDICTIRPRLTWTPGIPEITIADTYLETKTIRQVTECTHGSDHYPITLTV